MKSMLSGVQVHVAPRGRVAACHCRRHTPNVERPLQGNANVGFGSFLSVTRGI
jgi:hypothetical protein